MIGYVALIAMIYQRRRFRWFEAAGRLPLTNYLLQTVVLITIFCGFGLGYVGRVDYIDTTLLALMLFLLQMAVSALYLNQLDIGPFECLWRRTTAAMLRIRSTVKQTP